MAFASASLDLFEPTVGSSHSIGKRRTPACLPSHRPPRVTGLVRRSAMSLWQNESHCGPLHSSCPLTKSAKLAATLSFASIPCSRTSHRCGIRLWQNGFIAFMQGYTGAGLFGKLRRPGAPTEFIHSRTVEESRRIRSHRCPLSRIPTRPEQRSE
jgi:hypothetical protein